MSFACCRKLPEEAEPVQYQNCGGCETAAAHPLLRIVEQRRDSWCRIAGFCSESVQGVGGAVPLADGYLPRVYEVYFDFFWVGGFYLCCVCMSVSVLPLPSRIGVLALSPMI